MQLLTGSYKYFEPHKHLGKGKYRFWRAVFHAFRGVEKTDQGYKLYLQANDDGDDTLLRMAKDEKDIVKFLNMYLNRRDDKKC